MIDGANVKKGEEIDAKIKNLTERISKTTNEALIKLYENEIEKLLKEKGELKIDVTPQNYNNQELGTAYDKVMQILEHPIAIWKSDNIEEKRTVLYMYFNGGLAYNRDSGFGTPKTAVAINLIRSMHGDKKRLVEMPGVEPGSGKALLKTFR